MVAIGSGAFVLILFIIIGFLCVSILYFMALLKTVILLNAGKLYEELLRRFLSLSDDKDKKR
jgi:ABC-type multidrug transport system permease subunit